MLAKYRFFNPALCALGSLRISPGLEDPASSACHKVLLLHTAPSELYPSPLEGKHAQPFNELPGKWKNRWTNLYHFWKEGGFHNVHKMMIQNFQTFGPIYRSGEAWRQDRLILNKEALSLNVLDNFVPLLNEVGEDFLKRVEMQIGRSPQRKWTADFANELFRFALESICNILYGTRLGLLQDFVDPENQRFIDAVSLMFHTTSPMLYIPPKFLRWINSKIWLDHVKAWDVIFTHADRCIQNIYRDLSLNRKSAKEYRGILSSLLMQDKLHVEDIKASITEMMAGGVDTTSMTLQWAMYELAKAPAIQERLRTEILAAKAASQGDILKVLKAVPLTKATIKEVLRLHPVAVTIQRYTTQELILQNYFIPAKTLVQVGIYAMGQDPRFFTKPEQFNPERWLSPGSKHFRLLGFGFGPRQCLGRRIAELEMQLFLIHMLEKFKIEAKRGVEVGTTFDLILLPDKPIYLTLRPVDSQL
ncbi:hypothetical protein JRQ81_006862 [Phrynocephalus forsythii]|uniref:Cholesterol side-chain cleavage enzyme, mitochondrial n=1 Tax=Phrynocephalus forsythii TaxID=171643 RepID=A0A9Q0XDS4_9SAUR|nr:hypothetical protein JRQ81_006862 [Phrynocephalus forsythii]